MFLILIILSLLPASVFAVDSDLCDILDIPNCRGVTRQLRRNTFQSAPTSSTAGNLNPSNIRFDKGVGVEAIAQSNNKVLFGLVTGTGKMGGALISGAMDNTFFGNRIPEHDEEIIYRYKNNKQFENDKLSVALAGRLFASRRFGLDIGLIVKQHNEIKKINPGAGFAARFGNIHFGASILKDDYNLDMSVINRHTGHTYADLWGQQQFRESFIMKTYTAGIRIKNLSFDIAGISSELEYYQKYHNVSDTKILIYALSYYHKDILFNAALRKEHSGFKPYLSPDDVQIEHDKSAPFFSVQYSLGKHIVLGVNYNYFLLREVSGTCALFF